MLTLHTLKRANGASKRKKVVGRGKGSGHGKYSTRGGKGQTARTGHSKVPAGFEGGRTPLIRQLPKLRGFRSLSEKAVPISLTKINAVFKDGETVNLKTLQEKGLVHREVKRVKILAGKLTKKLKVTVPISNAAKKSLL